MIKKGSSLLNKLIDFLTVEIWRIRSRKLSNRKYIVIRQLRVILLALRGFNEDKCRLWASALTFYSLLSVVPVVAMAFGVAKGFGMEKKLETVLYEKLAGQEEVVAKILEFSRSMLENTQGGLVAGVGVLLLFWTVIKMLGLMESSFNDIWGVRKARSLGRKLSDYLAIMLVCPFLLITSSSITVMVRSQVTLIVEKISLLGPVSGVIFTALQILPFIVIWVLFTFLYRIIPNTKVKFPAALIGAVVAGSIYQIAQWVYINVQLNASKYGAVYGSFAALPLFLIWLLWSWIIVLFGAEISFAEQNVETYEFEPDCLKVSSRFQRLVALRIAHVCVRRFCDGLSPWSAEEIANHLESPSRLVRNILFDLTESGVLSEVRRDDETAAFQPARDVDHLTVARVVEILEESGYDQIPTAASPAFETIERSLRHFKDLVDHSPQNLLLRDIEEQF